ncbi:uncharacterized protein LOC125584472 [Brassica napus]|uniref:uncharacterized protein LOC125584472 n=1 Tax=Brassica napus TaxID=3708 RepID=UPI0020798B22|nr:uncharacterized protein LOC125584472 [Brassica napus]
MAEACKIREMRFKGNSLSWAGKRDNVWIQCRLDRSFGNDAWFRLFPQSSTEYMSMWPSDHRPLRIEFALEPESLQRGRFYFDKRMFGKRGVERSLIRGWEAENDSSDLSVLDRIAQCRTELAKLKKASDWNSKTKIEHLQTELEKESSKRFPVFGVLRRLKQELSKAFYEEEIFWRQRSREEWLREGDRNTTYFHNVIKGKRIRNKIMMLKDIFGNEHFTEGSKGNIAVEYFRDLFTSSNPVDLETLFEGFNARETTEMNDSLTREVSPEEIKKATFGIKASSSPGEDGLTGFFYQKYWHVVGPKLIQDVQEMKDMRPISLCTVQYKIISRIMCNRLKLILLEIISETQGTFVGGRLITDNVIIAHELVHGLGTNEKIGSQSMAVKTDMLKAYDRLINKAKSSIIFGKGIGDKTKADVKLALGIDKEGGEGTYLGLPGCFKGSKRDLLSFIKEKLEGGLQGWYSKTLSQGAKEVLLKSVALALPFYAMSVFRLPKDLCAKITSAIVEYWWSSGDKKRKISWVAWQKLCKPKEQGGLGFHDIGKFNQALLGKQAWRIWNNPDSLVAKVLKGKYFRRGNFLECGLGSRPSFVGEASCMVESSYNKWIIDTIPRPPMYKANSVVNLALKEDSVRWGFSKDGSYNTRSGYKLLEALTDFNHPQARVLPPIEKQLWKNLWKIKAPPKIKHFIWRALSGALAIKERLTTRGIQIDTTCSNCSRESESICHMLFVCEKAKEVWDLANISLPQTGFQGTLYS